MLKGNGILVIFIFVMQTKCEEENKGAIGLHGSE